MVTNNNNNHITQSQTSGKKKNINSFSTIDPKNVLSSSSSTSLTSTSLKVSNYNNNNNNNKSFNKSSSSILTKITATNMEKQISSEKNVDIINVNEKANNKILEISEKSSENQNKIFDKIEYEDDTASYKSNSSGSQNSSDIELALANIEPMQPINLQVVSNFSSGDLHYNQTKTEFQSSHHQLNKKNGLQGNSLTIYGYGNGGDGCGAGGDFSSDNSERYFIFFFLSLFFIFFYLFVFVSLFFVMFLSII